MHDLEGAKAKGLALKQENSTLVKKKGARVTKLGAEKLRKGAIGEHRGRKTERNIDKA